MSKGVFLQQVVDRVTELAQVADRGDLLLAVWLTRGYAGGSADPIVQADIDTALGAGSGVTEANLGNFMFLLDQFQKFRKNQAVSVGDYQATLYGLRTDV